VQASDSCHRRVVVELGAVAGRKSNGGEREQKEEEEEDGETRRGKIGD